MRSEGGGEGKGEEEEEEGARGREGVVEERTHVLSTIQ